jgi:hypothetical protein
MGSKVIRNVTKILKATSGRLFGRVTAGTGRAEELTPSDVRTLISVYSTSEVDSIIGGITALTSADIDTLAEINAILTDADLASVSYVDSGLSGKQSTLISGTNIKTVNSTSLLGSGDIVVSASPGGSSGQMQWNDAGAFGGATAVVYATTGTHVTVTAQGATVVPMCVKGAASQSGNLFEARTSAGALVFYVASSGAILSANNISLASQITFNDTAVRRTSAGVLEVNNGTQGVFRDLNLRNIGVNGAISAGGGVGIAFIANATTVPTTNPSGGGVLYCEAGALKFRGSSGTVTTLGPA